MRYGFGFLSICTVVVLTLASFVGCGDEAAMLAPELFGTWDAASLEEDGISTDCPGKIQIANGAWIACGTDVVSFNADGTFVLATTTDQFGEPHNWRYEGTWSTEASTLTLTTTKEGPDSDSLQPLDPPPTTTTPWSVSGDTLAFFWPVTGASTVVTWYWNTSTHEDAGPTELRGL